MSACTSLAHSSSPAMNFSMYRSFRVVRNGVPSDGMPVVSRMAKMGKKTLQTRVTACL